jgi:hypothetical protein
MKPTAFSFRLNSRKGSGLGGTNLDFDRPQVGECCGNGRSEVERERLAQVDEGYIFRLALTDHVNFEALGDMPVTLLRDAGGERVLHNVGS